VKLLDVKMYGTVPYLSALEIQKDFIRRRREAEIPDTLMLLEHPGVITMGRKTKPAHLLKQPEFLAAHGTELITTDRGGDITWHGPGQIVGYIIADLRERGNDIKHFVESILSSFTTLLSADFAISAYIDKVHTGVWIKDAKITALGIAVKHGITMHGFSFNVCPDMGAYSWIVPCGIPDKKVTSLFMETGKTYSVDNIKPLIIKHFSTACGYMVRAVTSEQIS